MIAIRPALLLLALASPLATIAHAAPAANRAPGTPRTQASESLRRLDVNDLDLFVSNFGSIGYDVIHGSGGLYFPRGTTNRLLYTSGLWVGGKVNGEVRIALAEYQSEWAPGGAPGGAYEDPVDTAQVVYKTKAWTGDPSDTMFVPGPNVFNPVPDVVAHHAWSQYLAGAVPHGAPSRTFRLPDTNTPDPSDSVDVPGPDLPGDLATWCIYNDLNPAWHIAPPGSTLPLGLEVKQTAYAFTLRPQDGSQTVEDAAIVRYEIRNAGTNSIDSAYVAYWADPDIGGLQDDLVGWDGANGIGYAYNATNNDVVYGTTPPALGIVLLESPLPSSPEQPFGAFSFGRYTNGTDPKSSGLTYNALRGLDPQGDPWIDPGTLLPTRFPCSGDPLQGTGWLDGNPGDRRMLVSVGPLTLGPGESTQLTFALVVGQGASRFDSIRRMRCATTALRSDFARGFARPFDEVPEECRQTHVPTCPLTVANWAGECGGPVHLDPNVFSAIAGDLVQLTRTFAPPPLTAPRDHLCASLGAATTARQRAEREFYALEANAAAEDRVVWLSNGSRIGLPRAAPFSCPGLVATTVGELLPRCPDDDLGGDPPPSTGVDRALVLLARESQDDPATIQAYEDIASCLAPVNRGALSPSECGEYVPALATLVDSHATNELVGLAWYIADPEAGPFDLERREGASTWTGLASLARDGAGYVRYEDRAITPGAQYGYRLVDRRAGGSAAQGEVTVAVPSGNDLRALAVSVAFAPGQEFALDLAVPRAGELTWEVITMAGRRLAGGSLGTLPAGRQTRRLPMDARLASGVYFVRVSQGDARALAKAVFVH